jgi:hypothetical protein
VEFLKPSSKFYAAGGNVARLSDNRMKNYVYLIILIRIQGQEREGELTIKIQDKARWPC